MENLPFLRTRSVALKITKAVLFTQDNEWSQVLPSPADEKIQAEEVRSLCRESSVGSKAPWTATFPKIMLLSKDINKQGEVPHSGEVSFILLLILTVKTSIQRFSAIPDKGKSSRMLLNWLSIWLRPTCQPTTCQALIGHYQVILKLIYSLGSSSAWRTGKFRTWSLLLNLACWITELWGRWQWRLYCLSSHSRSYAGDFITEVKITSRSLKLGMKMQIYYKNEKFEIITWV